MDISKENYIQMLPSLELAAESLKGSQRRMFLGRLALDIGRGGRFLISKTLNINRKTLNKGISEVNRGVGQEDRFKERGRKSIEEKMPGLLSAIKDIVDGASQTDPKFTSTRLYTRLSTTEVRKQLIERGYSDASLPSNQTLWNKLHSLGYKRKKVAKTKPKKK